jgi:hypothetical protein
MKKKNRIAIIIVLLIAILFIAFYSTELHETAAVSAKLYTLEKDGFIVLQNDAFDYGKDGIANNTLHQAALQYLPPDYVFIDYVYYIEDAALSTFHRDVTSSRHRYNTTNPVYTLILYDYSGCLLTLCPGSHKEYPFCWSRPVNISAHEKTAFLFDSDLLHAGCANGCLSRRQLVQYKLCHQSDYDTLLHLDGIRMKKREACQDDFFRRCMRKCSYFLQFPIHVWFSPILENRYDKSTIVGQIQDVVPLTYYNR